MDDVGDKITDSDGNLAEIRGNYQEIISKIDSLTRSMHDFDSRLADVEEKRTNEPVSVRPKISSLYKHSDDAQMRNAKIREQNCLDEPFSRDILDHSPEVSDFTSVDAQEDFQSIKDSLQKVKLPPELKLNESKQGIKREDQQTLNVLSRTARYAETTLKLLSTFDDIPFNESVDNKLAQIVKIQQAQICYLRDEYASLIVQSKFDKATSQTFRALQKNTSGLNAQALQNLKLASAISASSVPKETTTSRPQARDSWRVF